MNKTKKQLEAELRSLKTGRSVEGWVTIILALIRWGAIVFIARYGFLSIQALAGRNTLTDIGINFLGKVEVAVSIAWISAMLGVMYGLKQRKLRRDTVERLQNGNKQLENKLDPNRTSSKLTSRGASRPEDVI